MHITMVKKIMKDGSPCRKCADVITQLKKNKLLDRIDQIVVADERDPNSEGMTKFILDYKELHWKNYSLSLAFFQ